MSLKIRVRRKPQVQVDSQRLNRISEACRSGASNAAERIGPAAAHTRDYAADRVLIARGWSAPRLEQAANYLEADLAPKVSSMLSNTAQRIEPAKSSHRMRNTVVTTLAAATVAGVAGMMMTRRNNAMRELSEEPAEPAHEHRPMGSESQVRS